MGAPTGTTSARPSGSTSRSSPTSRVSWTRCWRWRSSWPPGWRPGVYWLGNGGSAADAQHLAAELVGRFRADRPAWRSAALTTKPSLLTAVANDYGFETVFARQVEGLCGDGDVVIGISTSGTSPNVVEAMRTASRLGAHTVGLTGRNGGELAGAVDRCLRVPSEDTARIQEAHILLGHLLCECVERRLTAVEERGSA